MNWYQVFYWMTVADNVKRFFDATSNIFTFFAVVSFIVYAFCIIGKADQVTTNRVKSVEDEKIDASIRGWELVKTHAAKFFYVFLTLSLITWMGYVLTPTKKDCLLIVAGGAVGNFMSSDSSAQQLPSDLTKFLHAGLQKEIASLKEEDKKELGVKTPKEALIEKAKTMSKEELIKYLNEN